MVEWLVVTTTLKLACFVTLALLLIGIPISWWLSVTKNRFRGVVEALVVVEG